MANNYSDRHHILWERAPWSLNPYALRLRTTPSLIPVMDRDTHEEIHKKCPPVPLLGMYALRNTLDLFQPTNDTLESLDSLMSAIERSSNNPRFHQLERELAYLAVDAIELQRPFIKQAILDK